MSNNFTETDADLLKTKIEDLLLNDINYSTIISAELTDILSPMLGVRTDTILEKVYIIICKLDEYKAKYEVLKATNENGELPINAAISLRSNCDTASNAVGCMLSHLSNEHKIDVLTTKDASGRRGYGKPSIFYLLNQNSDETQYQSIINTMFAGLGDDGIIKVLSATDSNGNNILHLATNPDMVNELIGRLDEGAQEEFYQKNINTKNKFGATPLDVINSKINYQEPPFNSPLYAVKHLIKDNGGLEASKLPTPDTLEEVNTFPLGGTTENIQTI